MSKCLFFEKILWNIKKFVLLQNFINFARFRQLFDKIKICADLFTRTLDLKTKTVDEIRWLKLNSCT